MAVVLSLLAGVLLVVSPLAAAPARADTCTVSPILVNSCHPLLGAESGGYGPTGLRARMLEHEARIGRQLDVVHAYLGSGSVLSSDLVSLAKRSGTIALVNWRAADRWATGTGDNATVNAQIDAMADSVKALGSTKIMMAIHHEQENDISAGGDPACPSITFHGGAGNVADYVGMWHNVRARFDAKGVDNVVWVMNYMGWKSWNCVVKDLWPGNDYVDWVTWDPYPKTATVTAFFNLFYTYLSLNSDAAHDFLSKPWGLSEFGYVGSSQPAAYVMYDDLVHNLVNNVWPRLKMYTVWDQHTSSSHDDRVGYSETGVKDPLEQEHYNAFATHPLMTGAGAPAPGDTTSPTVAVTAPSDGDSVSGTVTVSGTASDDTGVVTTRLLVDGTVVSTDTAATNGPVQVDWSSAGVANGSHTLRVEAVDAAGNVGSSAPVGLTVSNVDTQALTAPTNFAATVSGSQVVLTWDAASDDLAVSGYRIYRDGVLLDAVGPDAIVYDDDAVADGTTYRYTLTAVDAAGNESDPSAPADITVGDTTAPGAATLSGSATSSTSASLSWTDATDAVGVTGYRVYRGTTQVASTDASTTSFVDTGLTDARSYGYTVRALDAAGNLGAASNVVTLSTPDATAPTVPTGLRATSGAQSVTLVWTASSDNVAVTGYTVRREGSPLVTLPASATTYTDSGLTDATPYSYTVSAVDAAGNESAVSTAVVRPTGDTTPPSAPTRLAGSVSGTTVRLTWTAATDNVGVTSYTVLRDGSPLGTSPTTAFTDGVPPVGRTISYTVVASDAAGGSGPPSAAYATKIADTVAPTVPTALTAVATTGQITLSWGASSDRGGVAHYYLYRGNAKYVLLGNVTRYVDTRVTRGTTYTYKVYAIDPTGNWSGSSLRVSATAK